MKIGNYNRILKPIKLNYVSIQYLENKINKMIMLTPTKSWKCPVWETNKIVESLYLLIANKMH